MSIKSIAMLFETLAFVFDCYALSVKCEIDGKTVGKLKQIYLDPFVAGCP